MQSRGHLSFMSRRHLVAGVAALSTLQVCRTRAATFPDKPIRVIVPFTPGGGTDIVARTVMVKFGEVLGATIVVDNRGGAGGMVGTEILAHAPPDGTTLGVVSASHSVNPSLYKDIRFDSVKDFQPLTQICAGPAVLVVTPSLPVHSVTELIGYVRARQGQLSFASAGSGTPPHLSGELFKSMTKLDIVHVPYRGNTQALIDVAGGRVAMSFPTIPSALPYIQSGQLRALAVTTRTRATALPDLPTIDQSGVPGYESSSWYGVLAPAGVPPGLVATLHDTLVACIAAPEVRQRLLNEGLEPVGDTPEQFGQTIRNDITKWAAVVRESGAKLD
jgi:tripartite-type tricarboxylate transporter receptor subunit TctC